MGVTRGTPCPRVAAGTRAEEPHSQELQGAPEGPGCQMLPNLLSSHSPQDFGAAANEAQPQHGHGLVWGAGCLGGLGFLPVLVGA